MRNINTFINTIKSAWCHFTLMVNYVFLLSFYLVCHSSVWLFYAFNFLLEIIFFFNLHLTFKSHQDKSNNIIKRRNSLAYVPEHVYPSFGIIKQNFNPERTFCKSTRLWNKVICSTHIAALRVFCDKIHLLLDTRDTETQRLWHILCISFVHPLTKRTNCTNTLLSF